MRDISGLAFVRVMFAVTVLPFAHHPSSAAWPELGRPVCTATGGQEVPRAASDGAGGAIIIWQDSRNGTVNIFAQHVRATGDVDPAWPIDGRALFVDPLVAASAPVIAPDGAGGAIVAWHDARNQASAFDIYAQHVLASGALDPAWPANGRALTTAPDLQGFPEIAVDGTGGAIVIWTDFRSSANLFAEHILASGAVDPRWPADGVSVASAPGDQFAPKVVSDGSGGAIVTWNDTRSSATSADVYAQHVMSSGIVDPAWPVNGRALSVATLDQLNPTIASDGAHGVIVTWEDFRDIVPHIFAQRVLGSGAIAPGWPMDGLEVTNAPVGQKEPIVIPDGAHGAIVNWRDLRNGGSFDLFAQHVLASGAIDSNWPVNGTLLSRSNLDQSNASIVTDGAGGAIVAWEEDSFIVAQHVKASGILDPAFPINGRLVRPVLTFQHKPALVEDGARNAIVAWSDQTPNAGSDIYAMQIRAAGTVTVCQGTAADLPAEVDNGVRLSRSGSDAVLEWNLAANATSSDVLRGQVSGLPVGPAGADERCLVHNTVSRTLTDADLPAAGESFWYLVRGENICGIGSYGFEGRHGAQAAPRESATCP
jgi:hypothetical protein